MKTQEDAKKPKVKESSATVIAEDSNDILSEQLFSINEVVTDELEIIKEYGEYSFAAGCSTDVFDSLSSTLGYDNAVTVYVTALIYALYGPVKLSRIDEIYNSSYLSILYPNAKVKEFDIYDYAVDLGFKPELFSGFVQNNYNNSSKKLSVDCNLITCGTDNHHDTKSSDSYYLLKVVDVVTNIPIYYRYFSKYCVQYYEKPSIKSLLDYIQVADGALYLSYYFRPDLDEVKKTNNKFIIELKKNSPDYTKIVAASNIDSGDCVDSLFRIDKHFGYFDYNSVVSLNRVIVCCDFADFEYINYINEGKRYSNETGEYSNFADRYPSDIVDVLETNLKTSAKDVFNEYLLKKSCCKDDDLFTSSYNYLRLGITDDKALMGMSFIIFVATQIKALMSQTIKGNDDASISQMDLYNAIDKLKTLKIAFRGARWVVINLSISNYNFFANLAVALDI